MTRRKNYMRAESKPPIFGMPGDPRKWVPCANAIAFRIQDGSYPRGEPLPELSKICANLGVSYAVLKRALIELISAGYVISDQRRYLVSSSALPEGEPTIQAPASQVNSSDPTQA